MERQPLLEKQRTVAGVLSPLSNAHVRRRRRLPLHPILMSLLLLVTVHFWLWPLTFGSSPPKQPARGKGVPLEGPLELTDPKCRIYNIYNGYNGYNGYNSSGGVFRPPPATFPLIFGAGRRLSVSQASRRRDDKEHKDEHWRQVHVEGDIVLRRADAAHPDGAVVVELVYNDERIYNNVVLGHQGDPDNQGFTLFVDDGFWVDELDHVAVTRGYPCALARVTVWVPERADSHLDRLRITSGYLGIKLAEGLNMTMALTALLYTELADVVAGVRLPLSKPEPGFHFAAKNTEVILSAGNVAGGPWALHHSLTVSSSSGSVDIEVEEQGWVEADGFVVDAAGDFDEVDTFDEGERLEIDNVNSFDWAPYMSLSTVSGDIKLRELPSTASRPGHSLYLESRSGSISVSDAVFSRIARVHTVSGDLDVSLRPLAPLADNSNAAEQFEFETSTVSGHTAVQLAYGDDQPPLDFLTSRHRAVSSNIDLCYPNAWAGLARLDTIVGGSAKLLGRDVHVLPDDHPHFPPLIGHHVEGTKGVADNASIVEARTTTGSILLAFPE